MLVELATVCGLITISGAAAPAGRRSLAWLSADGIQPPALEIRRIETSLTAVRGSAVPSVDQGARASSVEPADAAYSSETGRAKLRTCAPTPILRGSVERYLALPDVREGVDAILAAAARGLPGYASVLEVIKDPDESDDGAFLMVSICMSPDDVGAAAFVEDLIDRHWLQLAPHVRGAIGVGRELIPVG